MRKISKSKRKNPINRMDLSDKETEIYDILIYEINRKIKMEEEMKYKDKILIALLKNIKTELKGDYNSLDDIESSLDNIGHSVKFLKNLFNEFNR